MAWHINRNILQNYLTHWGQHGVTYRTAQQSRGSKNASWVNTFGQNFLPKSHVICIEKGKILEVRQVNFFYICWTLLQKTRPSLIRLWHCHLFGTRPLLDPTLPKWLIRPSGTNFSVFWIKIQQISQKKINLKMSSAKWQSCSLDLHISNLHLLSNL